MIQWLLFAALIFETLFFTRYDKKVYGNYLSPVAILSFPLICIILLSLLTGKILDFKPLSNEILLISIVGIAVFWSGSLFWSIIIPEPQLIKTASLFKNDNKQTVFPLKNIILILSWFIIVIMSYSFIFTFLKFNSISSIGTDEFVYNYSGKGFTGHVMVLGIFTLIYLIGMVKKYDYFTIITIILLIILLILQQVKTWLYVPIIAGIILRIYNQRKIKVKLYHIIELLLIIVILFVFSYYFAAIYNKGSFGERFIKVIQHMFSYIFSGILGFGEHINNNLDIGKYPQYLLMPFINIWNYLSGGEIKGVVSDYHVMIDNKNIVDVNVKTFFGTIYIYAGAWWGLIYTVTLSLVLYFNWIMSALSKNYWVVVLYAFLSSPLVIGWFDFYYNQLTFIELPFIIICFMLINKIFVKH